MTQTVKAGANDVVHMGAALFPPSSTIDFKTNKCVGNSIDVTRRILHRYNVELQVTCASAIRIYKLIENGDIDLTINVKSTKALADNVIFVEPAYGVLKLSLYERLTENSKKIVSAIRGFDYGGHRSLFSRNGFEFIDLPNSISVARVFEKERSDYMLTYEMPVRHFINKGLVKFGENVKVTPLWEANNYYAIVKASPKRGLLTQVLSDYAEINGQNLFSVSNAAVE